MKSIVVLKFQFRDHKKITKRPRQGMKIRKMKIRKLSTFMLKI